MLNIFISQQNVMVRASTNPHHNSLTTITEEESIKAPSWNASNLLSVLGGKWDGLLTHYLPTVDEVFLVCQIQLVIYEGDN